MTARALLVLTIAGLVGACAEGEPLPEAITALTPQATRAQLAEQTQADAPAEPAFARPPEGTSWRALGKRLLAAGRPAQAERAFRRALAENGEDVEALAGAGIAAAAGGRLARARHMLEAAQRLDPAREDVNVALGEVLLRTGETEAARRALRTAFVVSSGKSRFAADRLARAEAVLAADPAVAAARAAPDPALAFHLARTGRSEFRLQALAPVEREGGVPVGEMSEVAVAELGPDERAPVEDAGPSPEVAASGAPSGAPALAVEADPASWRWADEAVARDDTAAPENVPKDKVVEIAAVEPVAEAAAASPAPATPASAPAVDPTGWRWAEDEPTATPDMPAPETATPEIAVAEEPAPEADPDGWRWDEDAPEGTGSVARADAGAQAGEDPGAPTHTDVRAPTREGREGLGARTRDAAGFTWTDDEDEGEAGGA